MGINAQDPMKSSKFSISDWSRPASILLNFKFNRSQLGTSALGVLLIKLFSMVILFANTVLLAKILGRENFGAYSFVLSLINVASIPVIFGLPNLIKREVAKTTATSDWSLQRGLLLRADQLAFLFSIVILAGIILSSGWLVALLGENRWKALLSGMLVIPLGAFLAIRGASLMGLKRVALGHLPEFVIRPGVFCVLLLVTSGVSTQVEFSAGKAMGLFVISSAIALVISWTAFYKYRSKELRIAPHQYRTSDWLGSLVPLGLFSGLSMINGQTDLLILGAFRSDAEVGDYRISVQLATLIVFGLSIVNATIAPHIAHFYAIQDLASIEKLMKTCSRLLFGLTCLTIFLLYIGGPYLIHFFFGADYAESFFPFLILSVGQTINALVGSVALLLNMTGHEKLALKGMVIAATLNVTLNLLLIPFLGMYGAAIATTITLVAWNLLLYLQVRRVLNINPSWLINI